MTLRTFTLAVLAALITAAPAGAQDHSFVPPQTGPLAPVPGAAPIRDVVIQGGSEAADGSRKAAAAPALFADGDGHTLSIQVSDSYGPNPAASQALATFFGTFAHGAEMNRVKVVVLTPDEVNVACGAVVLACYGTASQTMYVSGDGDAPGQAPNDFVMAHEYGHHLARNSINPPFSGVFGAGVSGPKYWASYAGVCPGVEVGYFSLDVVNSYYRFPGEVFAETFAQKRFPGVVPWQFDTNPPTQGDFDAIERDVRTPWTAPTTARLRGKFGPNSKSTKSRLIQTPLDGTIEIRLKGPRKKANFDLSLLTADGKGLFATSAKRRAKETVETVLCGHRTVRATVKRVSGAGKYELRVTKP